MQGSNSKIKPPLNTRRIIEHQRLNVDRNSSNRKYLKGKKKQFMLLLEKRLGNFFLKNNKKI